MGRRLPWKRSETSEHAAKDVREEDEKPKLPAPSPRVPTRTPPARRITTPGKPPLERARSPSTSPPPEPPPESFMIPGPLDDDRYRMVEDEFLSTAQLFTAHLHRAEYNRLKTAAKATNAEAIREIERPVVGSPTKLARQRRDAFRRVQRQRERLASEGAGEGSMPRMSSGLQGLMDSPGEDNVFLRPFPQATLTTRAAAGFSSSNASPSVRSAGRSAAAGKRRVSVPEEVTDDDDLSSPVVVRTTSSKLPTKPPARNSTKEVHHEDNDDDDEDDPFGIQKRRIRREKSREQLRKTAKSKSAPEPDVIPTFL